MLKRKKNRLKVNSFGFGILQRTVQIYHSFFVYECAIGELKTMFIANLCQFCVCTKKH